MFVNISPDESNLSESYESMKFAIRAGGVERHENSN